MSATHPDINAALVRKVKELSPAAKTVFANTFNKAPLMLAFLKFLQQQKQDKFNTRDAVAALYNIKSSHDNYSLYENRFFKLRKKLYDYFNTTVETNPSFTKQEVRLHEIKNLFVDGKYAEAYPLLIGFEKELWDENVFELLPEVLDMLIYNHQISKKMEQSKPLYDRVELAIELLADLGRAKMMARQIYDVNLMQGIKAAAPLFIKLQRLSIQHKAYPRFKLIYNLISATCKLSGGGLDFKPDFKVTSRFIAEVDRIHTLHPTMPDYRFIAGYSDTQNYMFENLKVMNHFNSLHFKDAAVVMKRLYDSVLAEGSPMKKIIGPAFYTASCQAFFCAERYQDAFDSASLFLKHVASRNIPTIGAYLELINAHIGLHPASSGLSDKYIASKIEDCIKYLKTKAHSHYYLGVANWLKVKLLLAMGNYKLALSVFNASDFSSCFIDKTLYPMALQVIQQLSGKIKGNTEELLSRVKISKLKTPMPTDYMAFVFLEKQLRRKV